MRISDWSSDVCSSDLEIAAKGRIAGKRRHLCVAPAMRGEKGGRMVGRNHRSGHRASQAGGTDAVKARAAPPPEIVSASACGHRSEEHTSELQSLMRISYAVFCLKKKNKQKNEHTNTMN